MTAEYGLPFDVQPILLGVEDSRSLAIFSRDVCSYGLRQGGQIKLHSANGKGP